MSRDRIAPSRRLGPSKRDLQRRAGQKIQHSTPSPEGLPPGRAGRVEHMRAHALSYFTVNGPRDPQGTFLWNMADALDRGIEAPAGGGQVGNQNARK